MVVLKKLKGIVLITLASKWLIEEEVLCPNGLDRKTRNKCSKSGNEYLQIYLDSNQSCSSQDDEPEKLLIDPFRQSSMYTAKIICMPVWWLIPKQSCHFISPYRTNYQVPTTIQFLFAVHVPIGAEFSPPQ